MLYITGDTHIPHDIHKLSKANFGEQNNMMPDKDFVLICGDFGGVWDFSKEEKYWMDWLGDRNFTTLFIDGNHENHAALAKLETANLFGGQVGVAGNHIYHLRRGNIYTVCGRTLLTMGGAQSTDKEWRVPGVSWWEEELPCEAEYQRCQKSLELSHYKADYIITHCAPLQLEQKFYELSKANRLTAFLDSAIEQMVSYQHWYFGHYHLDKAIDKKHTCLYDRIMPLA